MEYRVLPLRLVNFGDERFRTSYFSDLEEITGSIQKAGLLSPPLLCRRAGRYVLVTGWKRALACRRLKIREIPVLISNERSDRRLLLKGASENAAARPVDLVEKAEIIRKLRALAESESAILKRHMPRLNLPATGFHLELVLKLSAAPEEVRRFVREKSIPVSHLETLFHFSRGEQMLLLPLLRPLSVNKQKEVCDNIREVCRRDDLTVRRLLNKKEARRILRSRRWSGPEKAERFREWTKRLRYPELGACREAFAATLRKIRWPSGVTVEPSPFWEGEEIAVSFHFKKRAELRAIVRGLALTAEAPELDELFRE